MLWLSISKKCWYSALKIAGHQTLCRSGRPQVGAVALHVRTLFTYAPYTRPFTRITFHSRVVELPRARLFPYCRRTHCRGEDWNVGDHAENEFGVRSRSKALEHSILKSRASNCVWAGPSDQGVIPNKGCRGFGKKIAH